MWAPSNQTLSDAAEPSRTALVFAVGLAAVHLGGFATWYPELGSSAGLFGLPLALWGAHLFGYPGALGASLWTGLWNVALTALGKDAGLTLADAFLQPSNLVTHGGCLVAALFAARQQDQQRGLTERIEHLKATERQLREAERQQTEARMKDRLHRADRMASVGTLAAGVAHEINNPLTYVIGNLYCARERLAADDAPQALPWYAELEELLRDATDGAERVRRIVRDLKTFSRSGDEDDDNHIQVKRAVEAATNLVRNEIRHRATLELDLEDLPPIAGNESRLVQVLVNLLMNASQAIPEGNAEMEVIRVSAFSSPDGEVVLEVSDSGCGMSEEVQSRVFDPFFTTKAVGEGTGLGLSVTRDIVASMGGDISVRSTLGEGSTFTVCLALESSSRHPISMIVPRPHRDGLSGAHLRALVVDDEPKVAASVARLLDGFSVVVVTDGREALERLRRDRDFDAILCDLMMPHLTGMELFERARAMDPQLAERFVFMTGGAFTTKARAFIADVANDCIEKPFDGSQLSEALHDMLTTRDELNQEAG